MSTALEVTTENFDTEVLRSDLPVLMDIFADWCGPCKLLSPVIDQIASENAGKLKVVKVNSELNVELATKFGVTSIPCLILFKNGAEIDRHIGYSNREELGQWLDDAIE